MSKVYFCLTIIFLTLQYLHHTYKWDFSDINIEIRRILYNLYHYLVVKIEKLYRGLESSIADILLSLTRTFPGLESSGANYFADQKIISQLKCIQKFL